MNFAQVKGITIPQGAVKQLSQGQTTLWKKRGGVLPADYLELIGIAYDGDFHYETGEKLYGSDVITITLDNTSTTGQNVFGSYNGTASGRKNFSLFIYGNGSSSNSYLRYGETLYRPKYGTGKRTLVFGGNGTTDGFATDVAITPDTFVTDVQAFIGWLPNSTSPHYTGDIVGRITAGNRLIWIPVERISDGEIGYYELNSGVFLTKTGTGTPVSLGYLDNPLPAGGIQVDYLYTDASNSDRFIESGITPGTIMSYEAIVKWSLPSNLSCETCGWNVSNRRYTPFRFYNMTEDVGYDAYYNQATPSFPKVKELKCKAVITPTGAQVDFYNMDDTLFHSATFTYNETDYIPDQTLPIMGKKNSATTIESGTFRGGLGRLKIYDDDHFGHLVADFNPCYYNGYFGMWEIISQTFKTGVNASAIYGIGQHWDTQDFWPNAVANYGYALNNDSNLVDDRGYVTSRTFTIPAGCVSVRFNAGSVNGGGRIEWYRADGTYRDYNGYNMQDREVAVPSGAAFVRLRINKEVNYLYDAYMYDVTHSEYIWKGINVI